MVSLAKNPCMTPFTFIKLIEVTHNHVCNLPAVNCHLQLCHLPILHF